MELATTNVTSPSLKKDATNSAPIVQEELCTQLNQCSLSAPTSQQAPVELPLHRKIQEILASQTDEEFQFRLLQRDDYDRGILNVLSQLTVVGDVSKGDYEKQFDWMFPSHADTYFIVVIIDKKKNKAVGSATLMLERKFVRNTGTCGHVEDVAVDSQYRGKKLGLRLVKVIKELGIANACYKITLDCNDSNVGFYEQNGFKLKEKQMCWYREENNHRL